MFPLISFHSNPDNSFNSRTEGANHLPNQSPVSLLLVAFFFFFFGFCMVCIYYILERNKKYGFDVLFSEMGFCFSV